MPDLNPLTFTLDTHPAYDWTVPTAKTEPVLSAPEADADDTDEPPAPAPVTVPCGTNLYLDADRKLARGWPARARDNLAAIRLSKDLEASGRIPTPDEQSAMLRFIGFGATELAQNCFPLPGTSEFRNGWADTGRALMDLVSPREYATLQRATQYAHFTPEPIGRALWRAAQHLGFTGGRVLEPGMGTGLFFALLPPALRGACRLTGIEYEPVTARIARLVFPEARVRCEDYTRSPLGGGFDLAIGNPPFADRVVRADPTTAALGLRLHDYFIARSISRLRPGGIALFVTSTGTMDKANTTARTHIAGLADLIGAVRLPEASLRTTAGTDVVVDVLVFQRRQDGHPPGGAAWIDLTEIALEDGAAPEDGHADIATDPVAPASPDRRPGVVAVNAYFATHPEMVLGTHAQRHGIYGPGLSYTCRARPDAASLETQLNAALALLPAGLFVASAEPEPGETDPEEITVRVGTAADGATAKEGSYLIGTSGRLVQIIGGTATPVAIRQGRNGHGMAPEAARIICALLPIRDAVRDVLRAQAADHPPLAFPSASPTEPLATSPWQQAQMTLRIVYASFVRRFGPINHTVVSTTTDPKTGEQRETHRYRNLAAFSDDPDCWMVAAIEHYDIASGLARKGPIFTERVIAPPVAPLITSATDALAVTLSALGRVDLDHLADLLESDPETVLRELGTAVFRDPRTESWETADAYLSGAVRTKRAVAEAAAAIDPQYARNVTALRAVQPEDLPPSAITARLGAPWIPTDVVERFALAVMATEIRVWHAEAFATWTVHGEAFIGTAAGTSEWGTGRRHAGQLLHDALNSATPQIFDTVTECGVEKRILNAEATEAAKETLVRIKDAFTDWIWTDPDRTDRLARLYNTRFNNLVPRHFDGSHLVLPGASTVITLRAHQQRVVWRIIAAGSTYIAHAVGAGKSFAIAAAIMEQRRLGLITKAMLVVPGHCLAQVSREFLQLYPTASILVADETNFTADKRARFLARAAVNTWDAIVMSHRAFKCIAVPADFERRMIEEQLDLYEAAMLNTDEHDRTTRKRIEAMKEKLSDKLEALKNRRDDMLTIEELGIDQLIVDEAQMFRKLVFVTNRTTLKGVDPDGSQRAWDLFVKSRFIERKNPGRALIQASGSPVSNTLGELYSLLRYHDEEALRARGIHEFDAWAAAFGDTRVELELQPSGAYKAVERFCDFINVPELIDMFRTVADVVLQDDLRSTLTLPRMRGGQRQLITAPASDAFRNYQKYLARRIEAIEQRTRRPEPGDDILLSCITDGRHAAIDMRLVWPNNDNEPDNKLNRLISNVHRIWSETSGNRYLRPDGTPYPCPGAGQLIFSDLGTLSVEEKRGFSVYRWIKRELVRLGIPASEIAFMQDFKKMTDKRRLFNDFNAGVIRVLIGSSETMGTGVNVQERLKALHHLDVPWQPAQIVQREGRIERQGNQHAEIEICAYATLGSMDATMWQNNERKARFIAAALSGDRSIRRLEDIGSQADQFALAKAIASGDGRLMQKAGLENDIARLQRQRAAHIDDQHNIRRQIQTAQADQQRAKARITAIRQDLARRIPTRGDAFTIEIQGRSLTDRKTAGASLLSNIRLASLERATRDWTIGQIGGFALTCSTWRKLTSQRGAAELVLQRTDYAHAIEVPDEQTALGLIARLEYVLDHFESDLADQAHRLADATARLAGYAPRLGESFPLQSELDEKLARLAELDADLAQTQSVTAADQPDPSASTTDLV